jgi:hypothetical protein
MKCAFIAIHVHVKQIDIVPDHILHSSAIHSACHVFIFIISDMPMVPNPVLSTSTVVDVIFTFLSKIELKQSNL